MSGDKDFQISTAEFKGRVIADLDSIKGNISEIKIDLKTKACKKDVRDLRSQINNIKLASVIIGGLGGILTAVATIFGFRKI